MNPFEHFKQLEEEQRRTRQKNETNTQADILMREAKQRAAWIRQNTFDQSGRPYTQIVQAIKNEDGSYTIPI